MIVEQPEHDPETLRITQAVQLSQEEWWEAPALPLDDVAQDDSVNLGLESSQYWARSRVALVARLQAKVQAESYHVESTALAQCMLDNETHFTQPQTH